MCAMPSEEMFRIETTGMRGKSPSDRPETDPITSLENRGLRQGLPRRDHGVLLRLDGQDTGQVLSLSAGRYSVGRLEGSDLLLNDPSVSRRHARFVSDGDGYRIEDLGSSNGTYVNGELVSQHWLREGDVVQFGGHACFRFMQMDDRGARALRRLYESSVYDGLTGAFNRRYLDERLRSEVAFALRHGTECSLVILDVDHFKRINDTCGHASGDAVLREIASSCMGILRTEDVFGRFGGEEFVVLLRGIDLGGTRALAERLRKNIKRLEIHVDGGSVRPTVSAGCARLRECRESSPEELLAAADERLYQAKRDGRDRVA
jgi:two-component system, cell cycle response regulator